MVKSTATTIEAYLAELSDEQRRVINVVRSFIRRHLPQGYRETLSDGMISYEIPPERYKTRDGKSLSYIALAAEEDGYSLYLRGIRAQSVQEQWLQAEYEAAGKKLDLQQSRLRFYERDDLLPEVLSVLIATTPPEVFISQYEASQR